MPDLADAVVTAVFECSKVRPKIQAGIEFISLDDEDEDDDDFMWHDCGSIQISEHW